MSQWRLTLMRHGLAQSHAQFQLDFDRTLTRDGEREVAVVAQWYGDRGTQPTLILASPARRTHHTAEIVRAQLALPLNRLRLVPAIYNASLAVLIETIKREDSTHTHLFLVGHNPGMEAFARYLSGSDQASLGFSPGSIAEFLFDACWADIAEGQAQIVFARSPG